MKNIGLLGATGSIGKQALKIISDNNMKLVFFSVHSNIKLAKDIVEKFNPKALFVTSENKILGDKYLNTSIYYSEDIDKIVDFQTDIVLNAIIGIEGVKYTYLLAKNKKDIALANKESLVSLGHIIMPLVKENNTKLLPIDSEHSAIWQCMQDNLHSEVDFITLTASGGAFRDFNYEKIEKLKASDALKHPNWSMGQKITIDSATLVNKGLEIIEAKWLFDIEVDRIETVIHRESIVHSAVHFLDGSIIAQMGNPSMLQPIQYALLLKSRRKLDNKLSFLDINRLSFEKIDNVRFFGVQILKKASKIGGSMPAAINALNEVLVYKYLRDEIGFFDIKYNLKNLLVNHKTIKDPSFDEIIELQNDIRKRYR